MIDTMNKLRAQWQRLQAAYNRINAQSPRRADKRSVVIVLGILLLLLVYALRAYRLAPSFDIFVDEITYYRISESILKEGAVRLYGEPFHLHPHGFFYLQALYLSLFRTGRDLFEQIYLARYLNIGLAALTAVALFDMARRLTSLRWGIIAALLFGLDAFVIRMNSRNLLDTAAIWWTVAGFWVLLAGLSDEEGTKLSPRYMIGSACLFGMGMLVKDMIAFLTLLPLGFMFVTNWLLPRWQAFWMGVITSLTYAIYPLYITLRGELPFFIEEKFSGLLRLVGIDKHTGINRATAGGGGPTLVSKLLELLAEFGPTYALMALGCVAILIILLIGTRRQRIVAVWTAGAYGLLAYLVLFGTLEEQFFYFLIVPCMLMVTLLLARLLDVPRLLPARWVRRWQVAYAALLLVGGLLFSGMASQEWLMRHLYDDNGYEQTLHYLRQNLPPAGQVAASGNGAQFILGEYGSAPWGEWYQVADLEFYQPQYVLVSYDQIRWDYGDAGQPLFDWLDTHGQVAFEFHGRTNSMVLFKLSFDQAATN